MAALQFVGTTGFSVASALPLDTGVAAWVLIGTLVAGAVGISLAAVPPSTLTRWTMHRA